MIQSKWYDGIFFSPGKNHITLEFLRHYLTDNTIEGSFNSQTMHESKGIQPYR